MPTTVALRLQSLLYLEIIVDVELKRRAGEERSCSRDLFLIAIRNGQGFPSSSTRQNIADRMYKLRDMREPWYKVLLALTGVLCQSPFN
jgi:hypothetical protein